MHQLQGNKEYGSEKKGYLLKKSDGYVHSQPGARVCSACSQGLVTEGPAPSSQEGRCTYTVSHAPASNDASLR